MPISKSLSAHPHVVRLVIITAISLIFALAFNEISYALQKDPSDRAPTTIEWVIPAGTAAKMDNGQEGLSIPSEMVFVVGDVLEVRNEDSVTHQLGPVMVPAGATGRLVMEQSNRRSYTCSFSSKKYLGLDVQPATTPATRLAGLALTVPTLAVLLYLYSLAAFPIKPPAIKEEHEILA